MKVDETTDSAAATQRAATGSLSGAYCAYAIGLLAAINVFNWLDRQVVNILAESIKREMGLADWQIGAMTGLAFAMLYSCLGIPIARYAERGHRPFLIASAVTLWSGFTILCGFARNFPQLFLFRIGVGVGEAGCTPPAMSLIADYVPRERRGLANAVYLSGGAVGGLLGMVIGGIIADHWGWRAAFLLVGAPGLLLAAITALTLIEPRRRQQLQAVIAPSPPPEPLGVALRTLVAKRTYVLVILADMLKSVIVNGLLTFLPSFFLRNHGSALSELGGHLGMKSGGTLGLSLGLITGVFGLTGTILGGSLSDWFGRKDLRAQPTIPAVGMALSTPMLLYALQTDSLLLAFVLIGVAYMLINFALGPTYAMIQGLVTPSMRATATAIYLFVMALVGHAIGPVAIGAVSDLIAGPMGLGDAVGMRWSLFVFVTAGLPAALLFWLARSRIREETVS